MTPPARRNKKCKVPKGRFCLKSTNPQAKSVLMHRASPKIAAQEVSITADRLI